MTHLAEAIILALTATWFLRLHHRRPSRALPFAAVFLGAPAVVLLAQALGVSVEVTTAGEWIAVAVTGSGLLLFVAATWREADARREIREIERLGWLLRAESARAEAYRLAPLAREEAARAAS